MEDDILNLDRPGGATLAYCYTPAKPGVQGTTLVFLPGYMSDMEGGKALAVDAWAKQQGRAMLRLDYSGCGASGDLGFHHPDRFVDGRLADVAGCVVTADAGQESGRYRGCAGLYRLGLHPGTENDDIA